ncbi:MAG: hypothetical protein IKN66_05490 [Ruminococcus sp.]|nr:hypothetical protein [Ruminococcus sp.]
MPYNTGLLQAAVEALNEAKDHGPALTNNSKLIRELNGLNDDLNELPEYEPMNKNVQEDKRIEYALDEDGGRLFDSFMSQRNILRQQGKNVTKDNFHKEKRAQKDMENFI